MGETYKDLKAMQELSLANKIMIAQAKILDWIDHFDAQVYVSFSGGKDSCVLADLVARVWQAHEVPGTLDLVFSDTRMEFIDIVDHTKRFTQFIRDKYQIDVELVTVSTPHNTHEIYKEIGYPILSKKIARQLRDLSNPKPTNFNTRRLYATGEATSGDIIKAYKLADKWIEKFDVDTENYTVDLPFKVSEKCCNYFKKNVFREYEKQTNKYPFSGTMAADSMMRRNAWGKTGCNNYSAGKEMSKPLSPWTNQDVLQYIIDYDVPISSVYGDIIVDEEGKLTTTGANNTGCKYCIFGAHLEKEKHRFKMLKELEPKSYEYAMREENGLGLKKVLDFLDIEY